MEVAILEMMVEIRQGHAMLDPCDVTRGNPKQRQWKLFGEALLQCSLFEDGKPE